MEANIVTVSDGMIDRVEAEMRNLIAECPSAEIHIEPVHKFLKRGDEGWGVYSREITIPAGASITGKIHKGDQLNIVSKGCITVWDDSGVSKTFYAGDSFISPAGARRFGHAHEETVWTTIHATNETDLDKLEDELIVKMQPLTINTKQECLG